MKILHTGDIHLKDEGDERWAAFETIIRLADRAAVNLLVVSGDMFDRNAAADRLKPALRRLLEKKDYPVVILPGNHDDRALKAGDFFGETVTVLDRPGRTLDVGTVRLTGLPFENIGEPKVIERLRSLDPASSPAKTNILLYHGELCDKFFDRSAFGETEEREYMPARLAYFEELGFDYVLAGHFHSRFQVFAYPGGYFVYPGSPVSVSRRETGRRGVNLFETGRPPRPQWIDTFHYETVDIDLSPTSADPPLERIEARLAACHELARIDLVVRGHVNLERFGLSESALARAIGELSAGGRIENITQSWRDVSHIVENDIFKRFINLLEAEDVPGGRREAIRLLVMEAFSEAVHAD
jgi:exonuclease SbcD